MPTPDAPPLPARIASKLGHLLERHVPAPAQALAARVLPMGLLYTYRYFAFIEREAAASAPAMAATIARDLAPASVLDVGCGTGALLGALGARGVPGVGLEYAAQALAYAQARGLDVRRFDLAAPQPPPLEAGATFDAVVSLEVAEHLPARVADRYVDLLSRHVAWGGHVVFTAAPPGQGGTHHVNEQPPAYWIARFARRGLALDETRTRAWRAEWAAQDVAWWYARNLMVFGRPATPRAVEA